MNFSDALKNETRKTYTENGAEAYNSTSDALLDLFGSVGALRNRHPMELYYLVEEAYKADPLFATKIIFYARDIREGCGEREVFRNAINYLATEHPEAIEPNITLIPEFGRWDDLYCLIKTPLEDKMWYFMRRQWNRDMHNYLCKQPISLLAKWIKTPDASSVLTRKLGCLTAHKLGYSRISAFKKQLRALRKWINVTEVKMSANKWDEIDYESVSSNAMNRYRSAFYRHDEKRFDDFVNKAVSGEVKINSSTLYPYDIVEKILDIDCDYYNTYDTDDVKEFKVLEAQWNQLPNYVEEGTNAIVMADVSGSMWGRPIATSIGLALYFAERNVGAYHNVFMTFSSSPKIVKVKGKTLADKIFNAKEADWGGNTNLEKAFKKVLDVAIDNNVPPEEMVKSIIVVSDMEIDSATWTSNKASWSFYDKMRDMYLEHGYEIPNIVFWNVDSRNNTFHADATRKGVQLCSGQSINTFKQLMGCIGMTPIEMMEKVINSERYSEITIDK